MWGLVLRFVLAISPEKTTGRGSASSIGREGLRQFCSKSLRIFWVFERGRPASASSLRSFETSEFAAATGHLQEMGVCGWPRSRSAHIRSESSGFLRGEDQRRQALLGASRRPNLQRPRDTFKKWVSAGGPEAGQLTSGHSPGPPEAYSRERQQRGRT